MAYTQQQIDRLRENLSKGVLRARLGDEEVQFASLSEMRRQLSAMEAEMAGGAGAGAGAVKVTYPRTTRGL